MAGSENTNAGVEQFFGCIPAPLGKLAASLRAIVKTAAPQAREEIKWGFPCYTQNSMLCYIRPAKAHLTFGFYKGASLTDPENLLEGTGKGLRHVKIRRSGDIRANIFSRWIREAVELNGREREAKKC